MTAVRNNGKTGAKGWCLLRWFMAPLVLLALGLAGILMAGAHPIQDHSEHSMAAAISDIAPDGHGCCDEADPGHITGSCLGVGHCVACATGNAGMSAPKFSPETCFGLRLIILPSGLASGPSGRPPKAS